MIDVLTLPSGVVAQEAGTCGEEVEALKLMVLEDVVRLDDA